MLKLYVGSETVPGQRIEIVVTEKGLPCEILDPEQLRGQSSGARADTGGLDRTPVLDHDGFLLSGGSAILEYLEGSFPIPALMPPDERGRLLVSMYMVQCDMGMGVPLQKLGVTSFTGSGILPDMAKALQTARQAVVAHLGGLE